MRVPVGPVADQTLTPRPGPALGVAEVGLGSRKEPDMGDMESSKIAREARDAVGNQRPSTGESSVQAAMRRYLGAIAFRSREKREGDSPEAGAKPRPKN